MAGRQARKPSSPAHEASFSSPLCSLKSALLTKAPFRSMADNTGTKAFRAVDKLHQAPVLLELGTQRLVQA